jgi:UDP-N-acetylglucosamine 2-epimerase
MKIVTIIGARPQIIKESPVRGRQSKFRRLLFKPDIVLLRTLPGKHGEAIV